MNQEQLNIEPGSTPERKTNWRSKAALLIILFLLMMGVALYIVNRQEPERDLISGDLFPGAGDTDDGTLPNLSEDEVREQMQKQADESKLSFKINAEPVFPDGKSAGTLRIENPNHNVYPFVVEIFLNATGEKIYDSGGILPNHHIDTAKLDKKLGKGSHEAVAHIKVFDPESQEYQGESLVSLNIIVKN